MIPRISSGYSRAESAVEPTRSQKSAVTTFRASRGAPVSGSSAPQVPQNRNPLGLSVAQDMIARHGGIIEFESRPGLTIFSVLLPLEDAA